MRITRKNILISDKGTEPTEENVSLALNEFVLDAKRGKSHFEQLGLMYEGEHFIFKDIKRQQDNGFKPDNRLMANFSKYIVDTFNGYFIGKPVRISHENEVANDTIRAFMEVNDMDDTFNELSKVSSIYGKAYLIVYRDEITKEALITYDTPETTFIVYDNSIQQKPLFAISFYCDSVGAIEAGTVYTPTEVIEFVGGMSGLKFVEYSEHGFGDIPVIEFIENEERKGAFENVITLNDAFNGTISNKQNDLDYFADAYLKILGVAVEEEDLPKIVKNRIINFVGRAGDGAAGIDIGFVDKPNADGSQENQLNRLKNLIFEISMVANITDESFGNAASGISLEFKLQSMKNLAANKERKFSRGVKETFRLLASSVNSTFISLEDVKGIKQTYSRNLPADIEKEITNAKNATGIVSQRKQLELMASIIENPTDEIAQMEAERENTIQAMNNLTDTYEPPVEELQE